LWSPQATPLYGDIALTDGKALAGLHMKSYKFT
jgi:hypothetical protein